MNIIEKINTWCDTLESKSKIQSFGEQKIYFWFKENKKYYKIICVNEGEEKTHAFVDKLNGDIYKPSSRFYPKKIAIFNILKDYEKILEQCDWAGQYLGNKIKKIKLL